MKPDAVTREAERLRVFGEIAMSTRGWHFMRRENGVAVFLRIEGGCPEIVDVLDTELQALGRHLEPGVRK